MGERTDGAEQSALWNGAGGDTWVTMQPVLDGLFTPVEQVLLEAVGAAVGDGPDGPGGGADHGAGPERILDIGCGTGATTLALARRFGAATGVDVSAPMVDLARRRAADEGVPADFVVADAGRHRFPPRAADVVESRFGVMFFDDPTAAFANLRGAVRPGGALRAVVWRPPADNPFMSLGVRAAAPVLDVPEPVVGAPGQFGLADRDRTAGVLAEAGWDDVEVRPVDVTGVMAERDLLRYLLHMGPVGRVLRGEDAATRERVAEVLRPAFERFVDGEEVHVDLACWLVSARKV